MTSLHRKLQGLKGKSKINVALVSCPTPVLLDKNGTPYSPVRTNYFPHAQVLLGTEAELAMQKIDGEVKVVDLKSIEDPFQWRGQLHEYGEVQYGERKLTKCFIGDGFERLVHLSSSDIIGITSNFTSEANSVVETARRIRNTNPNAILLVGGRDASARSEFYLRHNLDIVAIGDSDVSFSDFVCRAYDGTISLDLIATRKLSAQALVGDLPLLDFSLVSLKNYKESGGGGFIGNFSTWPIAAYIETSRGCDRECDFCTEALTKRRNFDIEKIKNTVLHYKANGVRTMLFSDDNILEWLNLQRGEALLIELFNFLRDQNMTWEFSVGIELGRLLDKQGKLRKELMNAMFWNNGNPKNWAGAFRMLAPFENIGSELTLYKKLRSWEDNLLVIDAILEREIPQINVGIMFGWPSDSQANANLIRERVRQLKQILERKKAKSDSVIKTGMNLSMFCLMPLPGTPLFEQMKREGRLAYDIEKDPELWSIFASVINGDSFKAERITEIRKELVADFESEQPDGKVKPQFSILAKDKEMINFDLAIFEIIDTYLRANRNLEYYTNISWRLEKINEYTRKLECLRKKYGKELKTKFDFYQAAAKIIRDIEFLEDQRRAIDRLDSIILAAMTKRVRIAKETITWKEKNAIPIEDKKREDEIVERAVNEGAKSGLDTVAIADITRAIISLGKK